MSEHDTMKRVSSTSALPAEAEIDVDERDFERLIADGIMHPEVRLEDAVRQAVEDDAREAS